MLSTPPNSFLFSIIPKSLTAIISTALTILGGSVCYKSYGIFLNVTCSQSISQISGDISTNPNFCYIAPSPAALDAASFTFQNQSRFYEVASNKLGYYLSRNPAWKPVHSPIAICGAVSKLTVPEYWCSTFAQACLDDQEFHNIYRISSDDSSRAGTSCTAAITSMNPCTLPLRCF